MNKEIEEILKADIIKQIQENDIDYYTVGANGYNFNITNSDGFNYEICVTNFLSRGMTKPAQAPRMPIAPKGSAF